MRRSAIGEIVSTAIILAATGAVAAAMLAVFSEQAHVATDDLRSRLDTMRAQAVEQLDVTGTEWRAGGNLTFLVSNYGDYPAAMPFMLFTGNGTDVSNADVTYRHLNNTILATCDAATPCTMYDAKLQSKDAVRLLMPWSGGSDSLIIITDTGRAMRVGVN